MWTRYSILGVNTEVTKHANGRFNSIQVLNNNASARCIADALFTCVCIAACTGTQSIYVNELSISPIRKHKTNLFRFIRYHRLRF